MRAKRIYLQKLPQTKPGLPDALDFKQLLGIQLSEAPTGGYSVGQMKTRFELIDSLEAATEYWDIDFASWELLCVELGKKKWGLVSKNVIKFVEDIRDALDVIEPDAIIPAE
jgi:hypothetical protein